MILYELAVWTKLIEMATYKQTERDEGDNDTTGFDRILCFPSNLIIIRGPILCPSVYLSRHAFKNLEKEFVSDTGHGISIISQHGWLHIFRSKNWSTQNSKTSVRLCICPSVYLSVCLSRHAFKNPEKSSYSTRVMAYR